MNTSVTGGGLNAHSMQVAREGDWADPVNRETGTQVTCFTSTKVQILTKQKLQVVEPLPPALKPFYRPIVTVTAFVLGKKEKCGTCACVVRGGATRH